MRYLSVCSGVEAASLAWEPLGWQPTAFSEIDPFACDLLAHRFPHVPNWGDMTRYKEWPDAAVDLLVGGTPCQSYSVAGLRKGLADPRGNLMLTFGAIAHQYRPRWLVWENVPGVLSSDGGRDFGTFLGMLGYLGYGFAYRVLDAQHFGLAQRRKRVFVVGCLGDWRGAAAVLFERASLSGHPAPRREALQDVAGCLTARAGRNGGAANGEVDGGRLVAAGAGRAGLDVPGVRGDERRDLVADVRMVQRGARRGAAAADGLLAGTLTASAGRTRGAGTDPGLLVFGGNNTAGPIDAATACRAKGGSGHNDFESETFVVAHTLRGEIFDASEDGTGRGVPLVPVIYQDSQYGVGEYDSAGSLRAGRIPDHQMVIQPVPFDTTQITSAANRSNPKPGDPCHPLAASAHPPAVAFDCKASGSHGFGMGDIAPTLRAMGRANGRDNGGGQVAVAFQSATEFLPQSSRVYSEHEKAPALQASGHRCGNRAPQVATAMRVRRLMPEECEALQGLPRGWTLIPRRNGKPAKDGPRYKAIGNSMAVPCMAWIGQRIALVDAIQSGQLAGAA